MASVLGIVLMAGPASAAERKCAGNASYNVCLTIIPLGNRTFRVVLGIDYRIGLQAAQTIINAPGDPYFARIMGDDDVPDLTLFWVPLTGLGASAEAGLSADFERVVPGSWLDEDDLLGNRDEVYGRITFVDPRNNKSRTFETPNIYDEF
ncbi:hypothetical protein [Acrocarpospora sp. B8E8]|uniref:hypothetical protein n=1 Tax=Acrocarpospora sp. B8E8 TaxID=3153572 RepID=UPI00325CD12A